MGHATVCLRRGDREGYRALCRKALEIHGGSGNPDLLDPSGITAAPDGNLWFTESYTDQIGMINPTMHAITEIPIGTPNNVPYGITTGPDHDLWFTESVTSQIGQYQFSATTPTPTPTTTPTPTPTPTPTTTTTPTPTSPVTVTAVNVEKVTLGTGKHKKKYLVLGVGYSGGLNTTNTTAAQNLAAYTVDEGTTNKVGKVKQVVCDKPVPLTQAIYFPSQGFVALVPRGQHTLSKLEQVQVNVSLVTDPLSRPINNGQPLKATVTNTGLVIS